MIFSNNPFLIITLFVLCIIIQYVRYRHIASGKFKISGILIIKILLRSTTFISLIVASKAYINSKDDSVDSSQRALFIISSNEPDRFTLTEDDRIYLITRVPEEKYNQIEICLYNPNEKRFFQYIPATSSKTFLHLLQIERPSRKILYKERILNLSKFNPSNRIEFFEYSNNQWNPTNVNQDSFNIIDYLGQENSSFPPFLLHYLLILILSLLALDIGIKYRILKI